jgi:hypothetical protein
MVQTVRRRHQQAEPRSWHKRKQPTLPEKPAIATERLSKALEGSPADPPPNVEKVPMERRMGTAMQNAASSVAR